MSQTELSDLHDQVVGLIRARNPILLLETKEE